MPKGKLQRSSRRGNRGASHIGRRPRGDPRTEERAKKRDARLRASLSNPLRQLFLQRAVAPSSATARAMAPSSARARVPSVPMPSVPVEGENMILPVRITAAQRIFYPSYSPLQRETLFGLSEEEQEFILRLRGVELGFFLNLLPEQRIAMIEFTPDDLIFSRQLSPQEFVIFLNLTPGERAAARRPARPARPKTHYADSRPLGWTNYLWAPPYITKYAEGEKKEWSDAVPVNEAVATTMESGGLMPLARGLPVNGYLSRPMPNMGGVWGNYTRTMRNGSARQFNRNRSLVPVGQTNYRISGKSRNIMAQEMRQLMSRNNYGQSPANRARVAQLAHMYDESAQNRMNELDHIIAERRSELAEARGEEARVTNEEPVPEGRLSALVSRLGNHTRSAAGGLRSLWHRVTRRNGSPP